MRLTLLSQVDDFQACGAGSRRAEAKVDDAASPGYSPVEAEFVAVQLDFPRRRRGLPDDRGGQLAAEHTTPP